MTVMAIRTSGTNADLIADAAELGYLRAEWTVLDATWGKGNFWTKWRPPKIVTNDIDQNTDAYHHYDFRALPPDWERSFDVVVFDPPYKLQGTSSNAGPASSNAAYGMDREYVPVKDHKSLVADGLTECWRVLKPGGFLLYKTMDMVVSGHVEWQTITSLDLVEAVYDRDEINAIGHVRGLGGTLVDWLMLMGHREQPKRTRKCPECKGNGATFRSLYEVRYGGSEVCPTCEGSGRVPSPQQHAARNYSSLLVFRKGGS